MRGKILSASELRKIRNRFGLSPEEFGAKIGYSGAQIRAVEAGRRRASRRLSEAVRAFAAGTVEEDSLIRKLQDRVVQLDARLKGVEARQEAVEAAVAKLRGHAPPSP
jgi:transcriptional regulator with XRE-family HTH domain